MLLEPFDVEVMMNANSPKKTQVFFDSKRKSFFV